MLSGGAVTATGWCRLGLLMLAAMLPAAATAEEGASLGAPLYAAICATCHGADGTGKAGSAPDFTSPGAAAKLTDARISAMINYGHGAATRAQWAHWSGEQRSAVARFIRERFLLPANHSDQSLGKRVYARNCSVCHGDRGNGMSWARGSLNPPPFDFTSDLARGLTREDMIEAASRGRPGTAMVGYARKLAPSEIEAAIDFIRDNFMGAAAAAGMHDAVTELGLDHGLAGARQGDAQHGALLYRQNCVACHGEHGNGAGPRAYFILPRPRDFTAPAARLALNRPHLAASIAKGIVGSEMPAWETVLSAADIGDLAEYVFTTFVRPAEPVGDVKKN
jgi:mono/diheme cytochrome c family protein